MAPHYPCPQCGSTRFEEVDAIWQCYQGHIQEGGQQVGEDDEDFGRFGKVNRQKQIREKQKISKVYRGSRGFHLFLKSWQHILWRQSHTLIHTLGVPAELWIIVRELWALRLPTLTSQLDDPVEDMEDTSGLSTTSESGAEAPEDHGSRSFKADKKLGNNPTLLDTISLNYLGMMILRHPMTLSTVYKNVRQEKICYIRAIRYVPKEIRDRLAAEYHLALDTITVPPKHEFQLGVWSLATMYGTTFSMILPPINWRLILLANVERLSLPIEIFTCVKILARNINYDFTYPRKRIDRRSAAAYPEAQLMSLIVVATKLLHPFDSESVDFFPYSSNEPAAVKMKWDAWLDAKNGSMFDTQQNTLPVEEAIEITDADILTMPEEELDQYMDWFQDTYVKDVKDNEVHKQILDMFPLKNLPSDRVRDASDDAKGQSQISEQVVVTQSGLEARQTVTEKENSSNARRIFRPGQCYSCYRLTAQMSAPALRFHQDAAELACVNVEALLRACLHTERLLLSQQQEARRREYFAENDDMSLAVYTA